MLRSHRGLALVIFSQLRRHIQLATIYLIDFINYSAFDDSTPEFVAGFPIQNRMTCMNYLVQPC